MLEKLNDWIKKWIYKLVFDKWHNFKRGIQNLLVWVPVIWRDRQWDHTYIYEIFKHKLHLTEQFIRHNGIHVNNVKDADEIMVCVNALNNLIEDNYHEEAFRKYDLELTFNQMRDKIQGWWD